MSLARLRRLIGVAALMVGGAYVSAAQDAAPPRILLDQSPRAVEYQLGRLSDDQLARVERRVDDTRYVPVYYALLTRASMAETIREEAIAALVVLERTTRIGVLLEALQRSTEEDIAAPLLRTLLAQSRSGLAADRDRLASSAARDDASSFVRQGAYVALMLAAGEPGEAWDLAGKRSGHRIELLRGLAFLPSSAEADALRRQLVPHVVSAIDVAANEEERAAALGAVAIVQPDADGVARLADEVSRARSEQALFAALDGLARMPAQAWRAETIVPLVRSIVRRTTAMSPEERTRREAVDAIGLADRLAGMLSADTARSLRAELRALGVRVVRLETRLEQVAFDLRWFAVEANKPVQLVFVNPDAMPHNVVIGAPGSLERLGTQGGEMPMPSDPAIKPFVPDLPEVLHATGLVTQGNSARIAFVAPEVPGEYVFVCTFPGHWVRMYGVMLVVPDLDAWEAAPTVPIDPMTKQPFASQRME